MFKMKAWLIYLEDVLLEHYRDVEDALDSELCNSPDGQSGEVGFQWVKSHNRGGGFTSETHSDDDSAYLRVIFPACLCEHEDDVEAFARGAFDRGVARIRESDKY